MAKYKLEYIGLDGRRAIQEPRCKTTLSEVDQQRFQAVSAASRWAGHSPRPETGMRMRNPAEIQGNRIPAMDWTAFVGFEERFAPLSSGLVDFLQGRNHDPKELHG